MFVLRLPLGFCEGFGPHSHSYLRVANTIRTTGMISLDATAAN
jgi:hypothetical protein